MSHQPFRGPPPEQSRRSFARLMAIVTRRDYLRTVRRRGFIFGTALLPAAMAGMVVLATLFGPTLESPPPASLAVVNESDVVLVAPAGLPLVALDRSAAQAALERGDLREFYVVPADYPGAARVERVSLPGPGPGGGLDDLQRRSGQDQALAVLLRSSLVAEANVPPPVGERLLVPFVVSDVAPDGSPLPPEAGFGIGFLVPYGVTFIFVLSIFITSGYLLQSVTEEKESRVVEIVLSSVPAQPLMAGKILGLGAAGLTQVAIWVLTGLVALAVVGNALPGLNNLEVRPLVLLLALGYFILGYLAYGAIFAAIGAIAPGTREGQQYSGFFGFFAVIPLIFASAFLTDPGSPLVLALALIPLTAPAAMLQLLAVMPEPPWPLVLASLASLGIFAVVATVVASRIFRATLLLYGTRPSLRRILGAVTARG